MDSKQLQKDIFSRNLKKQLNLHKKTQADIVSDLNITSSTVSDWVNAKKYPRMDKVQMIADYLGIYKSDLIEEKEDQYEEHLKDKPELLEIYKSIQNNEMQLMLFDKTKDLSKEEFEQILRIIDAVHMENK